MKIPDKLNYATKINKVFFLKNTLSDVLMFVLFKGNNSLVATFGTGEIILLYFFWNITINSNIPSFFFFKPFLLMG